MHLSPHSLQQIDDAYLQSLDPEALRGLSSRLLADLKETRCSTFPRGGEGMRMRHSDLR